jgi:hypothetical protein
MQKSRFEKVIKAIQENLKLFDETKIKETKILVNSIRQIIELAD